MFLKLAFLALAATGGALIVGVGSKLEEKKSNTSGSGEGDSGQTEQSGSNS